jgi:hypothetical protein
MAQTSEFNVRIDALNEAPTGSAIEVAIPARTVLAIEGEGNPGSPGFRQGVRDLWRVAYAIQQLPRSDWLPDSFEAFEMPPTEVRFDSAVRDCPWQMFFPQPEFVDAEVLSHVQAQLVESEKDVMGEVFLTEHPAYTAVQSMHIGHPSGQPSTIAIIEAYAAANNLVLDHHHHEILIDDPVRIGFDIARNLLRYEVVSP